jgi:hypothetical protein
MSMTVRMFHLRKLFYGSPGNLEICTCIKSLQNIFEVGSISVPKLHENQTASFNKMSVVHKIVYNMKCTEKHSQAIRHVTMELVYACFINNQNNSRSTAPCSTGSHQSS